MKPIQDFSFMDYREMLLILLDKYLEGLDDYIVIQDDIDKVTGDMDTYPEDTRDMLEKSMRRSRIGQGSAKLCQSLTSRFSRRDSVHACGAAEGDGPVGCSRSRVRRHLVS